MEHLTELLGAELAETLQRCYGGTTIHVPRAISHGHRLAADIGLIGALMLTKFYGGSTLYVPMVKPDLAARNAEIISKLQTGIRKDAVAKQYGVSTRHIQYIAKQNQQVSHA